MKEITVGMKFQNRANKRMGQVVSIDLATSNAVLNVETANGQYKESKVSLAGLLGQKSWKYIHDDEVAGDGTPMNEVMQEILSDEELAAKKKLEAMLAPANNNINKAKSKAKAKVDAEIKQKAEEVKKADAEAAKAEKEENELLAHYQKDIKQKKQKQTESVKKEQAPAEKKAEKKEKPVKEKKERKKKEQDENWVDSFEVTLEVLKAFNYDIKRGASNIVILENNEKIAVIYKRKTQIRIYTTPDRYNKLSADLYDRYEESKYKVLKASFFVNTDDIKKVFDIIL